MPNALIYAINYSVRKEAEEIARSKGYRVKSASEKIDASHWLAIRSFHVVIVDTEVPISEQEQLANSLWKTHSEAVFVLFKPGASDSRDTIARLYGAELAVGTRGSQTLGEILERVAPETKVLQGEFRILVVEDLDSPRDIICTFLEGLGYGETHGVASAPEALEVLRREPGKFACVLTDIKMPKMTGEQLIEQVRGDPFLKHIPVIVLTAFGTADWLMECLRVGASGFLVKPPKRDDLERELGRARRILSNGLNPRLIRPDEVESVRELLEQRGIG